MPWMSGPDWEETLLNITNNNDNEYNVMLLEWIAFACKIIPIAPVPLVGWFLEIYSTVLQFMKIGGRETIYEWLLNPNNYNTDEQYLKVASLYHADLDNTRMYDSWNGLSLASTIGMLPLDLMIAFNSLNPLLWITISIFTVPFAMLWL